MKENTPKTRQNMKDKFNFYRDNLDAYPYRKNSPKVVVKNTTNKEAFNYYKVAFWSLVCSLIIYILIDKEIIQLLLN